MTATVESVTAAHLGRVVRLVRVHRTGSQPTPGAVGVCVSVFPDPNPMLYRGEQRVYVHLLHRSSPDPARYWVGQAYGMTYELENWSEDNADR